MTTYVIYYLETNMICIIMLLACFFVLYNKSVKPAADEVIFKRIIFQCMLYCFTDIVAAICKYMTVSGIRVVLYIANALYIALPAILTISWYKYVNYRVSPGIYKYKPYEKVMVGLLAISAGLTLTSPVTKFAFILNDNNIYQRTAGAYAVPILSLICVLYITVKVAVISHKATDISIREKAKSLVFFVYPVIVCSLVQMLVYGVTITQVGLTLGIVGTMVMNQKSQISKDELTRLNNRREFERYISVVEDKPVTTMMCMIDVNNFKAINDKFGHIEGDAALRRIANVLGKACQKSMENCFLCRYGGDEFLIACKNPGSNAEENLRNAISEELNADNSKEDSLIQIYISLGFYTGEANSKAEYENLLENADKKMYICKREISIANKEKTMNM